MMLPKFSGTVRRAGLVPLAAILVLAPACDDDPLDPTDPSHFGEVLVTVTTTGYEPDFTGYSVSLENGGPVATEFDDEALLVGAPAGTNTVELIGVPDHCTVPNNPATVTVTARERTTVDFTVTCVAITGSTTLTITQTGADVDFDPNLTALVDSAATGAFTEDFATNGPHTIFHLEPGAHEVRLQGIAPNCTPVERIQPVTIEAGADAPLGFELDCVPNVGVLRVTLTTTGTNLDTGYELTVGTLGPFTVGPNDNSEFENLRVGNYTVVLGGVAANCQIGGTGANRETRNATVTFGATTEVAYAITCQ